MAFVERIFVPDGTLEKKLESRKWIRSHTPMAERYLIDRVKNTEGAKILYGVEKKEGGKVMLSGPSGCILEPHRGIFAKEEDSPNAFNVLFSLLEQVYSLQEKGFCIGGEIRTVAYNPAFAKAFLLDVGNISSGSDNKDVQSIGKYVLELIDDTAERLEPEEEEEKAEKKTERMAEEEEEEKAAKEEEEEEEEEIEEKKEEKEEKTQPEITPEEHKESPEPEPVTEYAPIAPPEPIEEEAGSYSAPPPPPPPPPTLGSSLTPQKETGPGQSASLNPDLAKNNYVQLRGMGIYYVNPIYPSGSQKTAPPEDAFDVGKFIIGKLNVKPRTPAKTIPVTPKTPQQSGAAVSTDLGVLARNITSSDLENILTGEGSYENTSMLKLLKYIKSDSVDECKRKLEPLFGPEKTRQIIEISLGKLNCLSAAYIFFSVFNESQRVLKKASEMKKSETLKFINIPSCDKRKYSLFPEKKQIDPSDFKGWHALEIVFQATCWIMNALSQTDPEKPTLVDASRVFTNKVNSKDEYYNISRSSVDLLELMIDKNLFIEELKKTQEDAEALLNMNFHFGFATSDSSPYVAEYIDEAKRKLIESRGVFYKELDLQVEKSKTAFFDATAGDFLQYVTNIKAKTQLERVIAEANEMTADFEKLLKELPKKMNHVDLQTVKGQGNDNIELKINGIVILGRLKFLIEQILMGLSPSVAVKGKKGYPDAFPLHALARELSDTEESAEFWLAKLLPQSSPDQPAKEKIKAHMSSLAEIEARIRDRLQNDYENMVHAYTYPVYLGPRRAYPEEKPDPAAFMQRAKKAFEDKCLRLEATYVHIEHQGVVIADFGASRQVNDMFSVTKSLVGLSICHSHLNKHPDIVKLPVSKIIGVADLGNPRDFSGARIIDCINHVSGLVSLCEDRRLVEVSPEVFVAENEKPTFEKVMNMVFKAMAEDANRALQSSIKGINVRAHAARVFLYDNIGSSLGCRLFETALLALAMEERKLKPAEIRTICTESYAKQHILPSELAAIPWPHYTLSGTFKHSFGAFGVKMSGEQMVILARHLMANHMDMLRYIANLDGKNEYVVEVCNDNKAPGIREKRSIENCYRYSFGLWLPLIPGHDCVCMIGMVGQIICMDIRTGMIAVRTRHADLSNIKEHRNKHSSFSWDACGLFDVLNEIKAADSKEEMERVCNIYIGSLAKYGEFGVEK